MNLKIKNILENIINCLDIASIPSAVAERILKQYLASIIVIIVTITSLFLSHSLKSLIGFPLAASLLYLGISTKKDYCKGNIVEKVLFCSSVEYHKIKSKKTHIIFRTFDDYPQYYEFYYPGKANITPSNTYAIYYNQNNPSHLLGFTKL